MITSAAMAYALTKITLYSAVIVANPLTAPAAIVIAAPAIETAAAAAAAAALVLPLP